MQNFLSYANPKQLLTVRCWCVIKGDQLNVCRRRLSTLPTRAAYAQALSAGVDPSVLARQNSEQRTARDLLIRHYRYPPPERDQHSVFRHHVRGNVCARNARTELGIYRHLNDQKLGKRHTLLNHPVNYNCISYSWIRCNYVKDRLTIFSYSELIEHNLVRVLLIRWV